MKNGGMHFIVNGYLEGPNTSWDYDQYEYAEIRENLEVDIMEGEDKDECWNNFDPKKRIFQDTWNKIF
jgi:hypothetical protein